jgi:hypothetical protein
MQAPGSTVGDVDDLDSGDELFSIRVKVGAPEK